MNQDLLKQAINLFDTDEKWNSLLELIYNKEHLKNYYWNIFQSVMNEKFAKDDLVEGWSYWSENPKQYRWFLTEFGRESCYILFSEGRHITLWANSHHCNLDIIKNSLNSEKYSVLSNFLDRIDLVGNHTQWELFRESGNFKFGSSFDHYFPNDDRLSWFAGNRATEFVNQISEKINRLRKDPTMTALLKEINVLGKL
ncbi:hypothetical protein [uncultured Chryseobacterium sp.]|uniref:hypothetical protein n=1 Tax=uncultured Chryseobacterium sp. TaxID=259322 RepID=UPI0025EB529B|nr:hypothetical protein [uncultured Chryseobacterium sp.]